MILVKRFSLTFFGLLFLILLLGSFWGAKRVGGSWQNDITPPGSNVESNTSVAVTGTDCKVYPNDPKTTYCPKTSLDSQTTVVTVTLTCTDNDSGCAAISYTTTPCNPLSLCTPTPTPTPTPPTTGWITVNISPPSSPSHRFNFNSSGGSQRVWAKSQDAAGNVEDPPVYNTVIFGYTISGKVYYDYDHNGSKDSWDDKYSGATVTLSGPKSATADTDTSGNYYFTGLDNGTYTVTLSIPSGYQAFLQNPKQVTITNNNAVNIDFSLTPLYSISGNVFVDTNKNGIKDNTPAPGESNYNGGTSTITFAGPRNPPPVSTSNGAYTSTQALISGTYTISYSGLPNDYGMTWPVNGPPPFFSFNVGKDVAGVPSQFKCTSDASHLSSCDANGNLNNLNFGIINSFSWFQGKGGDMRLDNGFSDSVPLGNYALLDGVGGTPGVIFSGDSTPNFSPGYSSSTRWVAGPPYPEVFTPVRSGLMRTSYAYYDNLIRQNRITPFNLADYCGGPGLNNCTLQANLPNGVYKANGGVGLNTYTFPGPPGKNYVILVDGNLTLKGNILVPLGSGSTVTFAVSGDIIVDRNVGQALPDSTSPNLEGFFSADEDFVVEGNNNCGVGGGGADKRLNIGGTVVVNVKTPPGLFAAGSFSNQRDLCGDNSQYPSVFFNERPDFILNAPAFIKHPNFIWQEVAP